MDILLVPGFWLDASSWSGVTPILIEAGHRVHPLTLPGLESVDAPRQGIGLRDHIEFVAAKVDEFDSKVVLVGHSGGGAVIHGVADLRPDRIARNIYVDSGPPVEGEAINDQLPAVGDEIPLPPWDAFEEPDLNDLNEELRADFEARAIPLPKGVAQDGIHLTNERRFDVPATVIACEFPTQVLRDAIAAGEPWVAELAAIRDLELVDLPTGHWPQFTRPVELATLIAETLSTPPRRPGREA